MSSISSDKGIKIGLEGVDLPGARVESRGMEVDEHEEEAMSEFNLSDDEFTPSSKKKKKKEPPVKRVCSFCLFTFSGSIGFIVMYLS